VRGTALFLHRSKRRKIARSQAIPHKQAPAPPTISRVSVRYRASDPGITQCLGFLSLPAAAGAGSTLEDDDEGEHPMKRLLALALLGAALATPAAAQSVPRTHRPPGYQTQDRVHVYGADVPQPHFRETRPNPDFQLGNSEE
jgi:hypothetical protein